VNTPAVKAKERLAGSNGRPEPTLIATTTASSNAQWNRDPLISSRLTIRIVAGYNTGSWALRNAVFASKMP